LAGQRKEVGEKSRRGKKGKEQKKKKKGRDWGIRKKFTKLVDESRLGEIQNIFANILGNTPHRKDELVVQGEEEGKEGNLWKEGDLTISGEKVGNRSGQHSLPGKKKLCFSAKNSTKTKKKRGEGWSKEKGKGG